MCLAQGPQRSDAGEAQTRSPSVSSQALSHCASLMSSNVCVSHSFSETIQQPMFLITSASINPIFTFYIVVVKGTTGIKDTHTASLYELAFTAMCSVSGQCWEVKQRRARIVAGWVTQALEQGLLGSCAHAGYHQYYNIINQISYNSY